MRSSRVALLLTLLVLASPLIEPQEAEQRSVLIEVYHRGREQDAAAAIAAAKELESARAGLTIVVRDVASDPRDQERLTAILKHFKIPPPRSPTVVYACNRVLYDVAPPASWATELRQALQLEVFVRTGCSRCASAKKWLGGFMAGYPGLEIVLRDVAVDASAAARLSTLIQRHKTRAASVPVFHLCDTLVVGFDASGTTEERLRTILKPWTHQQPERKADVETTTRPDSRSKGPMLALAQDPLPLPAPQDPDPQLPLPDRGEEIGQTSDHVNLPWFGPLSASDLGMPLFTLAVGLVDGFNPCAMWVLLFLLSILVNLRNRARILAIAGTFVVVSGLAYFAFMAAWLNVFVLIGYLRPIQIGLGILAILIGAVHVKDFFAFKQGISLSIPESARPGIYARVRRIVTAEHLAGAIAGAVTLAVLVNLIELLCTSGLPALYTNILVQRVPSSPARYGYLSLYILAYMLDDVIMVAIVVVTLSKKKLQESGGRWLKLVSGAVILLLGIVMLVRPEWLQ